MSVAPVESELKDTLPNRFNAEPLVEHSTAGLKLPCCMALRSHTRRVHSNDETDAEDKVTSQRPPKASSMDMRKSSVMFVRTRDNF